MDGLLGEFCLVGVGVLSLGFPKFCDLLDWVLFKCNLVFSFD